MPHLYIIRSRPQPLKPSWRIKVYTGGIWLCLGTAAVVYVAAVWGSW